jgi:murein DD-endopeptidase MepM/ murein hydrolase activator NlpD
MGKVLGGLLAACIVLTSALPAAADQKLDKARATQRTLQQELDAAALELVTLENDQFWADQDLNGMQQRLAQARAQLATAQRVLGDRAASIYQVGGASLLASLLADDAAAIGDRTEFVMMLTTRQADLVADAKAAAGSYSEAVRQVARAKSRSKDVRQRTKVLVARLTERLDAAKAQVEKLSGFSPTTTVGGRLIACPVSRPYSYVDTWGAARSGGRSHKGTDIMNPYGNKLHAYVDGVISRETTSSLGGITLYLQGDDGNEYYYAHLSRYFAHTGQRVQAGELIAYNGDSGNASATAPHLHFEVHPGGGAPVNPYPWVVRACG